MTQLSTKLSIPHQAAPELSIVGVLEQVAPDQPTSGRKLALILHGTLGHKDYLFLKRLALRLPIDSFRFDFRGNHETGGTWKQGAIHEDIEDLLLVVEHLKKTYGYVVDLVVGHSRGSIVGFHWISHYPDGRSVSAFVNASGRYRMQSPAGQVWKSSFNAKGYHEWQVTVARKAVTARIHPTDVEQFVSWDTSFVWDKFPSTVDVFTLHGLSDNTVPPYDAVIYARALSSRTPGTHTLHLMEDADHNFTGRQDEVVDVILDWWETRSRGGLTSGLWLQGIRGKL
ncbi:hypothetical protein PC9H_010480 [Pleurotus ostreatus]|uniref:Peptidase S9 prolyl oligopeptidase catalytic domain-containing protein n=1 Tax=Pleurotus ostreatus TaxID=5322 RepID=A0A8H7DNP0_PLEOS|nr:uncharacterized protein PC9H_010480 [Pleurotus ostreatus]KAF7422324.1 hypothetical protein PC9H_010480 [Pleurotus ostreatus]